MNKLPEKLDFLYDKNWVEDFLNQNSQIIFKKKFSIKVIKIERSKSYAPEAFNMLYSIELNGEVKQLRASGSTLRERETTFKVMKFLYENSLIEKSFVVPQALEYFSEYNLMFYFDVSGVMLIDFITEDKEDFALKLKQAGIALKHLHSVILPDFPLLEMDWSIDAQKILKYAPDLKDMFGNRLELELEKSKSKTNFVHGDYQLENIIWGDQLGIIDFGSSTLANKEMDLACFVTQLDVMLKRYEGNVLDFEFLKSAFLAGYGDFDLDVYKTYDYLYSLQILQALILIYEEDPNADKENILEVIKFWQNKIKEKYARELK